MKHEFILKVTVVLELQDKQTSCQWYLSLKMSVSHVLIIINFDK
jgi:hypothetical protein